MMRVSQETFYRQARYNILRQQYDMYVTNGQAASGKRINQPSDDPVGSITTQSSHRILNEITQYGTNVQSARDWLSQAGSSMQSMSSYLSQVKAKAEQASTGTYTSQQLSLIGKDVQVMLGQLVSLGNAQVDGKYIFAGTENNLPAVSLTPTVQSPAVASTANTGTGGIYAQGTYTGLLSRNVTLTVDPAYVAGSGFPVTMDYSYVDDYGRTVSGKVQLTGQGTSFGVDVGDGVQIYADQGSYAAGDTYTLKIGRQEGNQDELYANLSWNYRLRYNFNLQDMFLSEGNTNGKWNNILDIMANWQDALAKDSKVQDYFEAMPSVFNNPGSSGQVQVAGDYSQLKSSQPQFQVGGPIQFRTSDPTLTDATVQARSYQFYLDPASNTGVPSASNPVTLHYAYWDTGTSAWVNGGTLTATGTGPDNAITLPDNGGTVSITLSDAAFTTNNMSTFGAMPTGGPPPTANGGRMMDFYADKTLPSQANPVNLTYSFNDGQNNRRFGTVALTATGSSGAWTVPLTDSSPLNVASNVPVSTLQARKYEFYLNPASNTGVPTPANPITLHYRYWDTTSGAWVDGGTVQATGTGPENTVSLPAVNAGEDVRVSLADGSWDSTKLATWPPGSTSAAAALTMDLTSARATVSLNQGGTVDDGDNWSATLEQYQQGQTHSQEALAVIQGVQANLLKYNGDAGARLNNLTVRDSLLQSDQLNMNTRLSKVESADVATVTSNLTLYQNLYQAALQATALVTSHTLADYI